MTGTAFESVDGGEKWGRYSFLYNPVASITCKNGEITIEEKEKKVVRSQKPLEELRAYLARYKSPRLKEIPPFTGGFVGYFSYSMIGYSEPVKVKSGEFNDFDLMLFDKVIAYDHLKQKINIIVNISAENIEENYRKALADIEETAGMITRQAEVSETVTESSPCFTCNVSKEEFCTMVDKAKEYIRNGDIYQVVISRRFETEYSTSHQCIQGFTNNQPFTLPGDYAKDDVQIRYIPRTCKAAGRQINDFSDCRNQAPRQGRH